MVENATSKRHPGHFDPEERAVTESGEGEAKRGALLAATLFAIGDAVLCTDERAHVTYVNRATERLLGVDSDELLAQPIDAVVRLLSPTTRRSVENPVRRVLDGRAGSVMREEYLLAFAGGSVRPVDVTVTPVEDGGPPLGAVLVLRDLSEKKNLEQQVNASSRLAALGTLAAGIAHEVNNPLSIIVGSTDLGLRTLSREITRDVLSQEALDALTHRFEDVQLAAMRIRDIVHDLGVFAPVNPDPTSHARVSRSVVRAVQSTAHELRYRARLVQDVDGEARVRISETRLVQLLANLLLNAAQAIEPGAVDAHEVRLSVREVGTDVCIEVRDDGRGMTDEVRARVFEPFYTTKPVGSGSGLGLSVCHGIVTSAGGSIEVESELGRFSLFRVVLPSARERYTTVPPPSLSVPPAAGRRVLVIDDDAPLCRVMAALIGDPHEVTTCTDAEHALGLLTEGHAYDLILCDVMMAHVSGAQFFRQLHALHGQTPERLVFVTGGAFTREVSEFLRSIPNRCLMKPLGRKELQALLLDAEARS